LLFHPEFVGKITDIVVEFGSARYQELVDRFLLECQAVDDTELRQVWRTAIGGRTYWDAPVYEQFFHNVRAINWMRPSSQRVRVLLGDPPVDLETLYHATDKEVIFEIMQRDAHYAAVVEQEVLAKGRRALLIAGGNHLLRGMHTNYDPRLPNAATLLADQAREKLFVIEPLLLSSQDLKARRANLAQWPRPALAYLAGTWLGGEQRTYRVFRKEAMLYQEQADAVLYLGPREDLTASRADPAIYLGGPYREQLQKLSMAATQLLGQSIDLVEEGLHLAQSGPLFFEGEDVGTAPRL
jgi:hypothetical protein